MDGEHSLGRAGAASRASNPARWTSLFLRPKTWGLVLTLTEALPRFQKSYLMDEEVDLCPVCFETKGCNYKVNSFTPNVAVMKRAQSQRSH